MLLIFACVVPLLAEAREETMEERKRRVTRKYLRKRVELSYSEVELPDAPDESEEVVDSEKFKEPQVDLARQESGTPIPPPPRRPPPRKEERKDWLFSEETETEEDPFADPFAIDDPFALKDSKDDEKTGWQSPWSIDRDSSPYGGTQRNDRSSLRDQGTSGGWSSRSDDPSRQGASGLRTSSGRDVQFDFQKQERRGYTPAGGLSPTRGKTYNLLLENGRVQSPRTQRTEPSVGQPHGTRMQQQPERRSRTPYKSPYQIQREKQRQRPGSAGYIAPEQGFQRQDSFQQWKKRNPAQFDPTSKDAYVDEMMPRVRR
ncbi:MAG: hypothetical protein ABFR47_02660 [Verrucomicrobiota bacterium]